MAVLTAATASLSLCTATALAKQAASGLRRPGLGLSTSGRTAMDRARGQTIRLAAPTAITHCG